MENSDSELKSDFEASRLKELHNLNILDTGKEERFDRYIALIADIFNVPIVLISLVDANRQWFKSCIGLSSTETPRSISFCGHAMYEEEILVIPDATQDPRFADNPLVVGELHIRFYAGAVLRGPTGKPLGTLCIKDRIPRKFEQSKQNQLIQFARLIDHELMYDYHINEMRVKVENALYFDTLTGLPNRRLLKERLEQAIEITKPPQQIAVIALRINKLQELENAFGSESASFVIKETSERLRKTLDKPDVISHWEEDYFIIFITLIPQLSSLLVKLENIFNIFEKDFLFKQEKHFLTCNIGISVFPSDSHDPDLLVNNAIYAMRLLSFDSKPPYRFYAEESTLKLTKQYELERLLIKAIEEETLEVLYQPKVDIFSKTICGAESLCYWYNCAQGSISSIDFIAVAEQSDLIIKLGEWVLKQACKQNKKWQMQGRRKLPISVNVSKKQLLNKNFHKDVKRILEETNMDANCLDLEITESALINLEEVIDNIEAICKLGVTLSLDDFGTGFSSLSYLQRLPFKTLKIDKSFIKDMVINKRDAAMVRTIVGMSKTLDLLCVAEGVETAEQLLFLKAYQCDQMQGYLFSRPVTADEFFELLSAEKNSAE